MRPNFLIATAKALSIESFDVTSKSWARKFLSLVPSNLSPLLLRAVATTWSPFCRITYSTLITDIPYLKEREFTFNIFLAEACRSSSNEEDAWRHFFARSFNLLVGDAEKIASLVRLYVLFPVVLLHVKPHQSEVISAEKVSGRWWCQISPWGAVVVCYGREVVGTNAT